jgi:hypothetical protein
MRHTRLRSAFGEEILLVPNHAVRRLDRGTAEVVARRLLEADPESVRGLVAGIGDSDPEAVLARLVDRLVTGDLLLVELDDEQPRWHPPRAPSARPLSDLVEPAPIRPPAPTRDDQPVLLRLELGALGFPPLGVLTLPRADGARRHPWAALVTVSKYQAEHPGTGLVVVGHSDANESEDHARLRADALVAFLEDERTAWSAIASKWGRVVDTQLFFAALAREEGWPITIPPPTDVADDATARAVLEFQRAVNARKSSASSLFEDGVIGEQTLGAIFDVARASFLRWSDTNRVSADPPAWFQRPSIACASRFKPYRTMPPLPSHHGGRFVDLVLVPPEAAAKVDVSRAPEGAGIYDVVDIRTLVFGGSVTPRSGLALEIVLRDDRDAPIAGAKFEVVDATGRRYAGVLDDRGEARLDALPEGICKVAFPELQPGRWFLQDTAEL